MCPCATCVAQECGIEIWEPMDRGDNKVSGREARAAYRAEQRYGDADQIEEESGSKKGGAEAGEAEEIL